jgi:hypothetical protein
MTFDAIAPSEMGWTTPPWIVLEGLFSFVATEGEEVGLGSAMRVLLPFADEESG